MKKIWAPWRLEFISKGADAECIFCSKPKREDDRKCHIFSRGDHAYCMLNAFPYNPGHVLIAPYRHVTSIGALTSEEWQELFHLLNGATSTIEGLMHPHGYNIGFNLGAPAGGGFEHVHMHVVPRWKGDTNFMPILAETKVLPEHLDATYDRIVEALGKKSKART